MGPGAAVVSYAVATGIWGIVGHLLAAVEFALGWVDDVSVAGLDAAIGVLIYLLATDVFPT